MIFALRQPATLLGLLLGFAVGMIALTGATRLLDRNSRFSVPFWHPRAWLDPYSAVAAVLGGAGWAPRPEVRRGFGKSQHRQLWTVAVVAFIVPAALGAAGIAAYVGLAGRGGLSVIQSTWLLYMLQDGKLFVGAIAPTTLEKIALGFGIENLAIAVLSLIPIPPLPTGVAVWTVFPRTAGARRMAYRLLEEHWGIVAVLVLMIPLGSQGPIMLLPITAIIDPILHAF